MHVNCVSFFDTLQKKVSLSVLFKTRTAFSANTLLYLDGCPEVWGEIILQSHCCCEKSLGFRLHVSNSDSLSFCYMASRPGRLLSIILVVAVK